MAPTTYKLRLDSEQLQAWEKSAEKAGLKLAVWVRRGLDEYAGSDDQPVRRDPEVPSSERSTVPARRSDSVAPNESSLHRAEVNADSRGSDAIEQEEGDAHDRGPAQGEFRPSPQAPLRGAPSGESVTSASNLREMPPQPKATRSGFKKKGKPEKPSKAAGRMVNGMLICRHNLYADGCPQCKALGG